jgi:hypothetical protein
MWEFCGNTYRRRNINNFLCNESNRKILLSDARLG